MAGFRRPLTVIELPNWSVTVGVKLVVPPPAWAVSDPGESAMKIGRRTATPLKKRLSWIAPLLALLFGLGVGWVRRR